MFTLICDENTVTLKFNNDFLNITCFPENAEDLFETGFDSAPSNGDFNFFYDDKKIVFNVGKYGDGLGGSLTVELKMTSEIKESLGKALDEWREYMGIGTSSVEVSCKIYKKISTVLAHK